MNSPMSSAVFVSSVPTVISDIETLGDLNGNNQGDIATSSSVSRTGVDSLSASVNHLITPEYNGKPLFDPGDGDIKLQA